jgi:prolyl-tRNA synthetase
LNINFGKDFTVDKVGDIAMAQAGFVSLAGQKLIEKKGIEVGNIFQLGYYYSKKMKNATFVDSDGKDKPYYMGCYGIGVGRTMATVVENSHDERGIIWPENVAPYKIHLLSLGKEEEIKNKAEELYQDLLKKNVEVLFDDREASAGEKLADADLIGCPIRLVVSKKTLEKDSVEMKKRDETKTELLKLNEINF